MTTYIEDDENESKYITNTSNMPQSSSRFNQKAVKRDKSVTMQNFHQPNTKIQAYANVVNAG